MTTAETIQPALTAEEWERLCVQGECRPDEMWHLIRGWHPDSDERTMEEDDVRHHAIAAVALRDQPFGFTAEDAAPLPVCENCGGEGFITYPDGSGGLEEDNCQACDSSYARALRARLERVIPRIAALLPPK